MTASNELFGFLSQESKTRSLNWYNIYGKEEAIGLHESNQAIHGGKVWWLSRKYGIPVSSIMDFSANINDFLPEIDISRIAAADNIHNYPDTEQEEYIGRLSEYAGVSKESIFLGPGLTYFIYRVAEKYRGSKVLLLEPTFSEYRRAFFVNGCTIQAASSDKIEEQLDTISRGEFSIVMATRPDNPVGNAMDRNRLNALADACRKGSAILFVDEAFIDFMGHEEVLESGKMIYQYGNLILGRSLTKILSIPSLRLGYIISAPGFIQELKDHLEPWTVSQISLAFLSGVDFSVLDEVALAIEEERNYLIGQLDKLGLKVVGTPTANFATFKLPEGVKPNELELFCFSRKILIRKLGDHAEFGDNYVRIAVKRRELSQKLIEAISEFLSANKQVSNSGE